MKAELREIMSMTIWESSTCVSPTYSIRKFISKYYSGYSTFQDSFRNSFHSTQVCTKYSSSHSGNKANILVIKSLGLFWSQVNCLSCHQPLKIITNKLCFIFFDFAGRIKTIWKMFWHTFLGTLGTVHGIKIWNLLHLNFSYWNYLWCP